MSTHFIARTVLAAAAVAACSSAAQAQSSVTLYGIVAEDLVHVSNSNGHVNLLEGSRLDAPRIGFKGSEDLGGGLSAIFDLESAINPDTGAAGTPFWNRGSYVGLKGGFGTLTFGRHWNINDDLLGNFFIFGGYAIFQFAGTGDISNLFNNSAKYVSPSFSGFTVEAFGALGEGVGPRTAELAAGYDAGGAFKAAISYHESKLGDVKDRLAAGGASYRIGSFNGRFGYAASNYELSLPLAPKITSWDVGVDYTMGAAGLSVDYVMHDVKDSDDDTHFVRLLGTYSLSKRTRLNANIVLLKNKGAATQSFYGPIAPGSKQDIYTVGISHSF